MPRSDDLTTRLLGEALTFGKETYSETPPRSSPDYDGSGIKIGFGVFPVAAAQARYETRSPFWDTRTQTWAAEVKEVAIALGLSWRPTHWLAVGVAPSFLTGVPTYNHLDNDQPVVPRSSVRLIDARFAVS